MEDRNESDAVLVLQLVAFERPRKEIAAALGITVRELIHRHGAIVKGGSRKAMAILRARLISRLMDKAQEGNVGAIREYLNRIDARDVATGDPDALPAKGYVSKKAVAKNRALKVDGAFAPPPPPSQRG